MPRPYDVDPTLTGTSETNEPLSAGDPWRDPTVSEEGERLSLPVPYVGIKKKDGLYYWQCHTGFVNETHPDRWRVNVYWTDQWVDTTGYEYSDIIDQATLVWTLQFERADYLGKPNVELFEKVIDEAYHRGYIFARVQRFRHTGPPTVLVPFPSSGRFVVPGKLQQAWIVENGYIDEGSTNSYSEITVIYTPPPNRDGFYGVSLYVEGYMGVNTPFMLQTRRYDPSLNGMDDIFQVRLNPYAPVIVDTKAIGSWEMDKETGVMLPENLNFWPDAPDSYKSTLLMLRKDFSNGDLGANDKLYGTFKTVYGNSRLFVIPKANVNISTSPGKITVPTGTHYLSNGTPIMYLSRGGTNIPQLTTGNIYYVTGAANDYFYVEATVGGGAIAFTGQGNDGQIFWPMDYEQYREPEGRHGFANNTGLLLPNALTDNPVIHGDTLICNGESMCAVVPPYKKVPDVFVTNHDGYNDTCEVIIDHCGDANGNYKKGMLTGYVVSNTTSDTYESGKRIIYANYRVLRSCKFYLVAVNEAGFHGPLENNALTLYCALDGDDSALGSPMDCEARQYATQNTITWSYSEIDMQSAKEFVVYRASADIPPGGSIQYKRIGTQRAAIDSANSNRVFAGSGRRYGYTFSDADIYNAAGNEQTNYYGSRVIYAVSVCDKSGRESALRRCKHFNIVGVEQDYIEIRKTSGLDIAAQAMARNANYNLLYNSRCSWQPDGYINTNILNNPNFRIIAGAPGAPSGFTLLTGYWICYPIHTGHKGTFSIYNAGVDRFVKYSYSGGGGTPNILAQQKDYFVTYYYNPTTNEKSLRPNTEYNFRYYVHTAGNPGAYIAATTTGGSSVPLDFSMTGLHSVYFTTPSNYTPANFVIYFNPTVSCDVVFGAFSLSEPYVKTYGVGNPSDYNYSYGKSGNGPTSRVGYMGFEYDSELKLFIVRFTNSDNGAQSLMETACDILQTNITYQPGSYIYWERNGNPVTASAVDTATDTITASGHGFAHREKVYYHSTGTPIEPLSNDSYYYVILVNVISFKLSDSITGVRIDLTSTGSGSHIFTNALRPASITWYDCNNFGGLGRSRLCVPQFGYSGIINRAARVYDEQRGQLLLLLDMDKYTPTGNVSSDFYYGSYSGVYNSGDFYISHGPRGSTVYGGLPARVSAEYGDNQCSVYGKDTGYSCVFKNGWLLTRIAGNYNFQWAEGQIALLPNYISPIYPPESASEAVSCARQYFNANIIKGNRYLTFSCQIRRTVDATDADGVFYVTIRLSDTNLESETNIGPTIYTNNGAWSDTPNYSYALGGSRISANHCINCSALTSVWTYVVIHIDMQNVIRPDGSGSAINWSIMENVYFDFGIYGDTKKYTYCVSQPMLNVGAEAAPYTDFQALGRDLFLTATAAPPTSGTTEDDSGTVDNPDNDDWDDDYQAGDRGW